MVGVNFATITITAAMRISRRLGTAQLLQRFYNVKVLFGNLEFVDNTLQTANSIEHSYFSCGSILNSNTSSAKHSVFTDSCELKDH